MYIHACRYTVDKTYRAFLCEDEVSFLGVKVSCDELLQMLLHQGLNLPLPVACNAGQPTLKWTGLK